MKNIERVWKAEQKYEAERKKIEELQKELKEERAREEITKFAEEAGSIKWVIPHTSNNEVLLVQIWQFGVNHVVFTIFW